PDNRTEYFAGIFAHHREVEVDVLASQPALACLVQSAENAFAWIFAPQHYVARLRHAVTVGAQEKFGLRAMSLKIAITGSVGDQARGKEGWGGRRCAERAGHPCREEHL